MEVNILLITGVAIFLGIFGGKLFKRFGIPQVVGYIMAGVLLGKSFFGVFTPEIIESLEPIINLALGLIGFRIGSELKTEVFKRYGRSIYMILIAEGMFAFLVVCTLVTLITHKLYLGLLLGALASATAPAATTDVLWEYKTRGPLTSTLLAIVALDDALALIIYGFASVFAKSLMTKTDFSLLGSIAKPLFELILSCLLGGIFALFLSKLLEKIKNSGIYFAMTIAAIISTVGLALSFKLDFILSSMMLGTILANLSSQKCQQVIESMESFSTPVYILFFMLVGSRLEVGLFLNISVVMLALVYLIGRTSGKIIGAWLGSVLSKAKKTVRKYLGICLFSQAGVAIGLAMVVNHNFSLLGPEGQNIGHLVLNVITATTFVVQIIGPACVKIAVTKSDEVFRNVTAQDIMESYKVSDFMNKSFSVIKEDTVFGKIMETIQDSDSYHFPVVNKDQQLTGLISFNELRGVLREQHLDNVICARDVIKPVRKVLYPDQILKDAFEIFNGKDLDYLPVVDSEQSRKVVGILEYYPLSEAVNCKILERQTELESGRSYG